MDNKFVVLDGIEIDVSDLTDATRDMVEELCEKNRPDLVRHVISENLIRVVGAERYPTSICLEQDADCPTHHVKYVDDDTLRYTKMTVVDDIETHYDVGCQRPNTPSQKRLPNFEKDGMLISQKEFAERMRYKETTLVNHREKNRGKGIEWINKEKGQLMTCVGHFCQQCEPGKETSAFLYFVYDVPYHDEDIRSKNHPFLNPHRTKKHAKKP
jgi:hypothetical protein